MRTKTIATAAAIALAANTAFAGGLSPALTETPVVETEVVAAAPSVNPTYIVVGVLAALLIAAAVSDDDETTGRPTTGQIGGQGSGMF